MEEHTVNASELVRAIQTASGLNQRELSRKIGHYDRYVEGLIHDGNKQRVTTVLELCKASNCELLLRTGDGTVYKIVDE